MHLTPADECDASAWRGRWPLGRGFERFYGFMGGMRPTSGTRIWSTTTTPSMRREAGDGYHLSADLADKAIRFVQDAKAVNPDKPWFMYFCPAAPMRRITCSPNGPTATRPASTRGYEDPGRNPGQAETDGPTAG